MNNVAPYSILSIGPRFKDADNMSLLIAQLLSSGHFVNVYAPAIESLSKMLDIEYLGNLVIETTDCDKSPRRKDAWANVLTLIAKVKPQSIVLLPLAPKALVQLVAEQWPDVPVYKQSFRNGDQPIKIR